MKLSVSAKKKLQSGEKIFFISASAIVVRNINWMNIFACVFILINLLTVYPDLFCVNVSNYKYMVTKRKTEKLNCPASEYNCLLFGNILTKASVDANANFISGFGFRCK